MQGRSEIRRTNRGGDTSGTARVWRALGAPDELLELPQGEEADGIQQKAWPCGLPAHVIDDIKSIQAKWTIANISDIRRR